MIGTKSLNVASCVPAQRYSFEDKYNWVEEQIKKLKPDLFVCPQEYHGGIQTIFFPQSTEKVSYSPEEIIRPYEELARRTNCGICIGSLIDDPALNERRERIYIIDPEKGCTGWNDKVALPAYDHIDARGRTKVFPETNISNREAAHECCGARLGILFCWESFSGYIWHALSRAQPDAVVSMVKFGVNGWPQKDHNEAGEAIVTGFGYGADGGWLERLQIAAKWDLAAPIICSTNSWNLPNKAGAICGQILPWEEKATEGKWARPARASSLWHTLKEKPAGEVMKERVQVDQLDFLYWRFIRVHKFELNEATNEWQSSEVRAQTMRWKVERLQRKCVGLPKLMAPLDKELKVKTPKGAHKKKDEASVLE